MKADLSKIGSVVLAAVFLLVGVSIALAGGDSDEDSTSRPGFKILVARFDGVSAKGKIRLTFNGNERLLDISDKTTIQDNDKMEYIPIKDLVKYKGRRVMLFHKDGAADSVFFIKILCGS